VQITLSYAVNLPSQGGCETD